MNALGRRNSARSPRPGCGLRRAVAAHLQRCRLAVPSRKLAFIASEYAVPSWNTWPTSMAALDRQHAFAVRGRIAFDTLRRWPLPARPRRGPVGASEVEAFFVRATDESACWQPCVSHHAYRLPVCRSAQVARMGHRLRGSLLRWRNGGSTGRHLADFDFVQFVVAAQQQQPFLFGDLALHLALDGQCDRLDGLRQVDLEQLGHGFALGGARGRYLAMLCLRRALAAAASLRPLPFWPR